MSGNSDELTTRQLLEALAPLASVARVLVRFGRNPVGFVTTIISLYIVDSVLNIGAFAVNSILSAFGIIVGFFDGIRVTLVTAFGSVGIDILGGYVAVQQSIANVVASAGAAAPFLAIGFASVAVYVGYRVGVALLGELPLGSSIVDLLGLR
ncbi:hypothetical protein [Haloarcula pellucida]|uniref:Uncharacterized protein n=1 Tax=Haloarcula pellucida TaxID=1427151 RepID=A0A830GLM5_9EURY|nr:hypothetical protein [Halomicroarcula pellucida]MBX0348676.1 hypothetical protein [Halomicroarcula pellucida]GGN92267.1 hypothetical protein GCM10009030_16330 [Halomicroarcula pellucida]